MKQTGMLVVSLRGVNFRFWSRLGCSGQSANIFFATKVSFRIPRRNNRVRTGHGKPGKSWNFTISFSRPGKS